jgi:hypothetical protein
MKNKSKRELVEYIKKAIAIGREKGIGLIIIEDENESDGMHLSIAFYKNRIGEGELIEEYRSAFYDLTKADLKEIKEETKVKKITMKEKEDFGEWVQIVEITL